MPKFVLLGDPPPVGENDTIEMVDDVARYDMVTFVRIKEGTVNVRVVNPNEYSTFQGTM